MSTTSIVKITFRAVFYASSNQKLEINCMVQNVISDWKYLLIIHIIMSFISQNKLIFNNNISQKLKRSKPIMLGTASCKTFAFDVIL